MCAAYLHNYKIFKYDIDNTFVATHRNFVAIGITVVFGSSLMAMEAPEN